MWVTKAQGEVRSNSKWGLKGTWYYDVSFHPTMTIYQLYLCGWATLLNPEKEHIHYMCLINKILPPGPVERAYSVHFCSPLHT